MKNFFKLHIYTFSLTCNDIPAGKFIWRAAYFPLQGEHQGLVLFAEQQVCAWEPGSCWGRISYRAHICSGVANKYEDERSE